LYRKHCCRINHAFLDLRIFAFLFPFTWNLSTFFSWLTGYLEDVSSGVASCRMRGPYPELLMVYCKGLCSSLASPLNWKLFKGRLCVLFWFPELLKAKHIPLSMKVIQDPDKNNQWPHGEMIVLNFQIGCVILVR
jgi:hypothetical protein